MLQNEREPDLKLLLGRAFLMGVERGDREMMVLFARAFLVQALANGAIKDAAS